MARSRAARVAFVAALLGSVGWGWFAGSRAAAYRARVVDVVDGDTIVVAYADGTRDTVRLLGVDTPETVHRDRPVECFGPEASAFTNGRLAGRVVTLERDAQLRDQYGRLLAYVHVEGGHFNAELLRAGYARTLLIAPNGERGRELLRAELDARAARRGVWASC